MLHQARESSTRAEFQMRAPAIPIPFHKLLSYTLTMQTRLIAALHGVKVKGCADYVDTDADDEREALFFVESAEMLAGMSKAEPVSALLSDSRAVVAKRGTRAVALLPVDWLRWTEEVQRVTTDFARRARRELATSTLEIRVCGTATASAKAGLRAEGWTSVKEHVVAGLAVTPAD